MSQGLQLLASALAVRSQHAISRLNPELFIDDERAAYDFVMGHYRRYGELPNVETCRENGIHLIPATQPFDYYFDRCRVRAVRSRWTADHASFATAAGRGDVEAAYGPLERMLRTYRSFDSQQALISLQEAGQLVLNDYLEATNSPGLRGISWGWDFVDEITQGQCGGDLSVIAARPGMGKSWTMAFLAVAAWRAGRSVLFVTMEMTVLQMARRIYGMLAGVNPMVLRRGMADQWAEEMFHSALDIAREGAPFWFVAGDVSKSVTSVQNYALETTPDIVFVDAAYLLDPAEKKGKYSKHEILQDVMQSLKGIALSRNIPVTISVQYNREAKKNKSTGLENIAGSDAVGQLASAVLSISEGPQPYQRTRRKYKLEKVRDGDTGRLFLTNFLINPPTFDFLFECDDEGERLHGEEEI